MIDWLQTSWSISPSATRGVGSSKGANLAEGRGLTLSSETRNLAAGSWSGVGIAEV